MAISPAKVVRAPRAEQHPGPWRLVAGGAEGAGTTTLLDDLLAGSAAPMDTGVTPSLAIDGRTFQTVDASASEDWVRQLADTAPTLALLVVDAREDRHPLGRRSALLASLLGVRELLLVINQMDRVGWREDVFARIRRQYRHYAEQLGITRLTCIPASAAGGDNLCRPSPNLPWYQGPTLLAQLAASDPQPRPPTPLRLVVRQVQGPDRVSGRLLGGSVQPGDQVVLLPDARPARVAEVKGQARQVELTLKAAASLSPGELIASAQARPEVADQFAAHLLWLGEQPLYPGRDYLLQIGETRVGARVTELKHRVQVDSLGQVAAKRLRRDDLAFCNLALDRAVPFDPCAEQPATGSFTLLDRAGGSVLACGMIAFGLRRASNIHRHAMKVDKAARAAANAQKPCVLWFTGLSGSGKSTVADLVEQRLQALGKRTMLLDGDNVRHGLNRDLGFTDEDRVENIRRVGEVAKLMVEAGLITLASFISPFRSERRMVRELLEDGEFIEIFVDSPLDVCEARDPKGLYSKARAGKLPNFTGIGSPYEPPEAPELRLASGEQPAEVLAEQVVDLLAQRGML
ncbi:adenylyl-sulfate kinase [Stutzerimonas azotifigens]|uniref:adenylyl-sulfate kinase n=1 Tax=Stutzerimonas azotifigens TaxID=291995 RepID=UPI000409F1B7|nr:adenylyl-sulfate kinase [Stutzerimonas azotifigens]